MSAIPYTTVLHADACKNLLDSRTDGIVMVAGLDTRHNNVVNDIRAGFVAQDVFEAQPDFQTKLLVRGKDEKNYSIIPAFLPHSPFVKTAESIIVDVYAFRQLRLCVDEYLRFCLVLKFFE